MTTALIALLAAGMAAQAAAFLEKANWLTALDNVVWDFGWLLSDSASSARRCTPWSATPTSRPRCSLSVYVAILLVTFVLMRLYGAPAKTVTPAPAENQLSPNTRLKIVSTCLK